jgi:hypothetical protein
MASDSPSKAASDQARRLAAALDAIEARLDGLKLGADPDEVARALAEPVRAFDLAAKETVR